ncbi:LOW QUALITY PROTEIN: hypothetical protein BC937DRAFT_86251 [Endogone sp. FLAS-F59071]|nr:LOW QUALITY PROTEIN: hypothetical protein BC937DRAFT_86251 [Endogone sp. FLAS-F59071]|eukprot:RUS13163.1 LOW QUALITY PROTEIN: hypothetical protein BC937DRAFT_86251 [Endogone sp. FLAS-F59071]
MVRENTWKRPFASFCSIFKQPDQYLDAYANYIRTHKGEFNIETKDQSFSWWFQTCTQFGYFTVSAPESQPTIVSRSHYRLLQEFVRLVLSRSLPAGHYTGQQELWWLACRTRPHYLGQWGAGSMERAVGIESRYYPTEEKF